MNYLSIILTSFLLAFAFKSNGQSTEVSFIHYSDTSDIGMEREVEFPLIKTMDIAIDSILNKNIRRDILFDTLTTSIDSALSNLVSGASSFWLTSEITFNKKDVISIRVSAEFCGANCNNYQEAFVYSLVSGNRLLISDILDSNLFYNEIVKDDVKEQYQNSINRIVTLKDSCTNCDASYYDNLDFFISSIEHARDEFKMNSFCLYNDSIEILDECHFNRIDIEMCPEVSFQYNWNKLRKYLKIKI